MKYTVIFGLGLLGISLLVIIALGQDEKILVNVQIPPKEVEKEKQITRVNAKDGIAIAEKKSTKSEQNKTHVNPSKKNELKLNTENVYEEDALLLEPEYQDIYTDTKLFSVVDESHEQTPSNLDFSAYGKPIILDQMQLRNLKEKQIINFPLNGEHILLVENMAKRKSGTVKIAFSLPNEKAIYRGFITVGNKATFGRIVTPHGSYELEVINGKGWIVDTREISKKIPEDGIDYLLPSTY